MQTLRKDPLGYLGEDLQELRAKNLYRPLREMSAPQAVHTVIDGKEVINLSSNNYLGLTTHPHLKEAAINAIKTHGVGTAAVRTIIGTMDLHDELEKRLAVFKHTEATLTFQSGFASNQGIIQ